MKWKINILCVIGILIGLVSLILPWCLIRSDTSSIGGIYSERSYSGIEILISGENTLVGNIFSSFILIFLIGLVLALVTPLGGIVQIFGSFQFLFSVSNLFINSGIIMIMIGWSIGFLSSIIILTGLLNSIRRGLYVDRINLKDSLITFRRING